MGINEHAQAGLVYAMADELKANHQVSFGLSIMAVLSAAAAVSQDLIDVELPGGGMIPTSLSTLVIAGSGEGKSVVDRIVFRVLREHDAVAKEQLALVRRDWEAELEAWKVVHKHLKLQLKKAVEKGDTTVAKEELLKHVLAKPVMPQGRRRLYADVTIPALLSQMSQDGGSALLQSSEGATILNGGASAHLQHLCAMWSGDSVTVDRVSSESFVLEQPRLTTAIMVQPAALDKFLRERGGEARGVGFLARLLVCMSPLIQREKVMGHRMLSTSATEAFEQRLKTLLFKVDERVQAKAPRLVSRMDLQAASHWVGYSNWIESEKQFGGRFCMAHDHAARLAENAARIAAILHLVDGRSGDIGVETLRLAIDLCDRSSGSFMEKFVPPPVEESWARQLDEYLDRYRASGVRDVKISDIMKNGPRAVRKKESLRAALRRLELEYRVRVYQSGRTFMVDVMPVHDYRC